MTNLKQPQDLKISSWLKSLIDFGPLVGFFIAFKLWGLMSATALLIGLSIASIVLLYAMTRKIAMAPLLTALIVTIFGGLTLWLKDERFIKMKPTIIFGIFSVLLFGGLALGRPLVKYILQSSLSLEESGWHKLSMRFAWFFAAMALLNEIVWRSMPTDFWVDFKVFGFLGLNFLFILAQMPLIRHYHKEGKD